MPAGTRKLRALEPVLLERFQTSYRGWAHDGRSATTRGSVVTEPARLVHRAWAQLPPHDNVTVLITPAPDGLVLDPSPSNAGRLPHTPQARGGSDSQGVPISLLLRATGLCKYGQCLQPSVWPLLLCVSDGGLCHAPMSRLDQPKTIPKSSNARTAQMAPLMYDRDLPLTKWARKARVSSLAIVDPMLCGEQVFPTPGCC